MAPKWGWSIFLAQSEGHKNPSQPAAVPGIPTSVYPSPRLITATFTGLTLIKSLRAQREGHTSLCWIGPPPIRPAMHQGPACFFVRRRFLQAGLCPE